MKKNEDSLRTILEARSNAGRNYLSGLAKDRKGRENLSLYLSYALEHGYTKPRSFYGVGGMKIFRDPIWVMRGIMKDDHRSYRENNFDDFPQKERGKMLVLSPAGSLMRNKNFMKKDKGMLSPYKKVIGKA